MKRLLFFVLLMLASMLVKSQDVKKATPIKLTNPTDTIGKTVIRAPKYPGGTAAFNQFVKDNFKQTNDKGQILLSFVVDADGNLTNIQVIKGLSDKANKEALRVLSLSPKWIPGTQNGKPVKVTYTVPINLN